VNPASSRVKIHIRRPVKDWVRVDEVMHRVSGPERPSVQHTESGPSI
jgi:hypothetical protein